VKAYGYGRVSTNAQDMALQQDAFQRAGVVHVVTEKWSSVGARPKLQALIASLRPGDSVTVYKLDRLGRSLQDLLNLLERIDRAGASFRSLTEPIDTHTPAGKLMYSILGAVAEFERSIIRERSIAGQVAALERGKRIGRPRILAPEVEADLYRKWQTGDYSKAELSRLYNVNSVVVYRVIHEHERPDHPWVRRARPVLSKYMKG
jgi:DNA invertase Pin-like site-specific DNA recombinase